MARRLGASDDQIAQLARGDFTGMEEAWGAAFRVAESMTQVGCRVPAEDFAALASQWSAGQIVEIMAVIGLFNYFNRFAIALDIPPTK